MIKISFIISFFVLNFLVLNFHSDMKGLLIMVDFYFLMIFFGLGYFICKNNTNTKK